LDTFKGILPPVDFLTLHHHCFVVISHARVFLLACRGTANTLYYSWGDAIYYPDFSSVSEAFDLMRCLLKIYSLNNRHLCELSNHLSKALSYLHKNLIVHGVCSWVPDRSHISPYRELQDISHDNIVVNHFCAAAQIRSNTMRRPLRSAGHLVYALLDFDISI
jgi:hypothetical protein